MHRWILPLCLIPLLGCAERRPLTLAPIGPAPALRANADRQGVLVVYSAWDRSGLLDPEHQVHSDYELLTAAGEPLMHVKNHVTPMIEDPATIPLAPGRYLVKARVQGYGVITVPVSIEARRTTALYMDDTTRPNPDMVPTTQQVKLPDGRAIGWASE